MTHNHISLSQKNHYKMKMIPIVSKKIGIPKKLGGEPGTLTGVCLCELLCVLLAQVTS